jgi:ribonuclease J
VSADAPSALNRPDELAFLALGGVGEIGMNLSLYGYAGRWLMIDCGISFADETLPGIDVIMPDPAFIAERIDTLDGLVVTHAHEDHIGAIPYLWPRLRCPVYATPFTAAVLRQKLIEADLEHEVPISEVPMSGRFTVGPFEIELVTLTHSIPEPNAVVLRTALGTVLHTGDWKFDPDPLVGGTADEKRLRQLGAEGVLAMICDSTNALRPGEAGSEADVRRSLIDLVGRCRQRVVVACFASNVARLESATAAALAHDRHVALVGRSLWRIEHAARETGYLEGVPPFLTDEEAAYLPRDKVLLICTGSQGEPRSALARIAEDDHPEIVLDAGDTVIFSSRIIPGNERAIGRLQNRLAGLGVEIITEHDHLVHVSGHPAQDELTRMYQMVRPRVAVPVHGETRHLLAQARLAEQCQVPQAIVTRNGEVVRLAPGPAAVIGEVPTGRLVVDGKKLLPVGGEALRSRQRMTFNGAALATIVVDGEGRLRAPPQVTVQGLGAAEEDAALTEELRQQVADAIAALPAAERREDASLREAARLAVRRSLRAWHGKKPVTEVHLVRI